LTGADEPVPPAGWLYAIVAPEVRRVKIGRAQDVVKRFLELQIASPSELMLHSATLHDNAPLAEAQVHADLARARLRGEWFDLADYKVDQWLGSRESDTPANALHDAYLDARGHPFRGFQIMGDW
jgi:Meiotically Up-regulated Gene 113 (MUG113) protein